MVGVGLAAAVAVVGIAWASGALSEDKKVEAQPVTTAETTPTPEVFPQGVYRYRLTKSDVIALDSTLKPEQVTDAVGTYTWTIHNGKISFHQTDCQCSLARLSGQYQINGKVLLAHWPQKAPDGTPFCGENCIDTLGWSFDGKALRLTPVVPSRELILFWGVRKPWVKIS
jgi:hypothetical protein